jgi:hypothetical protein
VLVVSTALIVAAALGAGIWLSRSSVGDESAVEALPDEQPTSSPTESSVPESFDQTFQWRRYAVGDCVTWNQNDPHLARTPVVPCREPHLVEMTGRVELDDRFESYPSDAQWEVVLIFDCGRLMEEYIGGRPVEMPYLRPHIIHPIAESWELGERYAWCGVTKQLSQEADASGALLESVGSLRNAVSGAPAG